MQVGMEFPLWLWDIVQCGVWSMNVCYTNNYVVKLEQTNATTHVVKFWHKFNRARAGHRDYYFIAANITVYTFKGKLGIVNTFFHLDTTFVWLYNIPDKVHRIILWVLLVYSLSITCCLIPYHKTVIFVSSGWHLSSFNLNVDVDCFNIFCVIFYSLVSRD